MGQAPSSYVVVFPTVFSRNRIPQLVSNIKKVLRVGNQQFRSVRRDGDIILVDANDPVFASSAVNLLFGVEKVAIARRVENDFKKVVSEISAVGGNLLLSGERFLVRVEGASRGFMTKDVELAATSDIIEKKSGLGAKPGTGQNHDKLLYAYLTKKNAYVCIFSDSGMGGVPLRSGKHDTVCGVYDWLSAVSCYETIKQGFNPKVVVCYRRKPELVNLARAVSQILPRLLQESVTIEVFRVEAGPSGKGSSRQRLTGLVLGILISRAESCGIRHVSVPVLPMASPTEFVDGLVGRVFEGRKIPVLPLSGVDSGGVFADARELGLERHALKKKKMSGAAGLFLQGPGGSTGAGFTKKELDSALKSRQDVHIRVGPNNVHDFLDSLGGNR